ncbi:MAG: HD-like signal output (HDOD) protein [Gammaproteobacteria bacterium]|jgi:HD-like signal output (HDOD) protein
MDANMTGSQTISSVRLEIQKIDHLPAMPSIAQEILIASNDVSSGLDDIAKIIKKDPALTAKIIGISNSAFFGFGRKVTTLEQAIINVPGLDLVKGFALSLAMSSVFNPEKCTQFDIKKYWLSAFLTAELASGFVNLLKSDQTLDPNQLYLNGLLHNIGILVLVDRFPNIMSELFATASENREKRLIDYETETIDFNHHEAGAWLAHRWKLPFEMIDIIAHHHDLTYQERNADAVILIGLCSRISRQWILQTNYDPMQEIEAINSLNIDKSALEKYISKLYKKLENINQLVDEIAR